MAVNQEPFINVFCENLHPFLRKSARKICENLREIFLSVFTAPHRKSVGLEIEDSPEFFVVCIQHIVPGI